MTRPSPERWPAARLLPLRPATDATVAAIVESLAAEVAAERRARRQPAVSFEIDAAAGRFPAADPGLLREAVAPLLGAACEAAAAAPPRLRTVVVTLVDDGRGLEIEVADSGPEFTRDAAVAQARTPVERLGGGVTHVACPEGGLAVTLRLPHHRPARRAA